MDLVNKGEYTDSTGPDVIKEICERSRIGLIAALAERIDMNNDYILSFREDRYERVTDQGDLMHGIKMAVSADPIVRCKDCKHWSYGKDLCTLHDMGMVADDFCSYGEKRDEKCKECWYWSEVHKRCENKCGCQFKPYAERKSDDQSR